MRIGGVKKRLAVSSEKRFLFDRVVGKPASLTKTRIASKAERGRAGPHEPVRNSVCEAGLKT